MRIEPNKQLVALYRYAFKCSVVAFIVALIVMQLYFESGDASLFLDEVSMPLILTIIVAVLFQSAFVVLCWLGIVGYPVFKVSKVFKLNRNATVMISLLVSIFLYIVLAMVIRRVELINESETLIFLAGVFGVVGTVGSLTLFREHNQS